MAVVEAAAKTALQGRLNAVATPIDPTLQAAICAALAKWVVLDIIPNLQILGATGAGPAGGPLPIVLAPGTVT